MMSNPSSSLPNRQGLHRRQNSTPVAFEAMKMQYPTTTQRQNSHRRGQSQDSRSPIRRQLHQRTGSTVSITNIGSTPHGQQILREAQQQRLARPGQQPHMNIQMSPQCGTYQTMSNSSMPGVPYDTMSMNAGMQNPQIMPAHSQYFAQEINMPMSAGLSTGFELDENSQHYFQDMHAMTQTVGRMPVPDRRMSQPDLRIHTGMRPLTPTQQLQTAHFPLTPAATPFRSQHMQYARSLQTSPVHQLQDDSIRSPHPVSMRKSRSLQGIVEQEETFQPQNFETADMPIPTALANLEPNKQSQRQQSTATTQAISKQSEKIELNEESLPFFDENGGDQPQFEDQTIPILTSSQREPGSQSPTRPALSPRRMSISDLNLEPGISASIEETNVTLDDIAQFIEGPDPVDNKWICKYEDCNKKFGRKENIKSHVQTHLGDRQFRCDHCQKCFVRGHDLKRHAKIHTGTKPYPCLCGNAFARHDALTRHRQRGMCIGAFDGIVKKVIKRGRPRKHRPDMDERVDKASRTRYNKTASDCGQDQYASSASSCSMSSWDSPPTETMDALSIRGQSPYDDMNLFGLHPSNQDQAENMSFPPDMFSFTPPASPGYSTGNKPSPSYRELTPTEIASISEEMTQTMTSTTGQRLSVIDLPANSTFAANRMMVQHSQQSLPGLSHSSSSPAADIAAFDFGSDDLSTVQSMDMSLNMGMKMGMIGNEHERNDFDSFLDYGGMEMGLDGNNNDPFFAM